MTTSAVKAENLGKKYTIGHLSRREPYATMRDALARTAASTVGGLWNALSGRALVRSETFEEFWALRNVSFDVGQGQVVGIIGRNGAGKSTLLKILSRITDPSTGQAELHGRVASLLEVGTGFHPELTGRENIFLNGAILGMPKAEIRRKFDEIVAFAGTEQFLDTPVKRYSSGMYVRLAFAVAAHLEPEIMVIDEVLAVGDAQFQKKCLGKIEEVSSKEGRTVLFVSHQMGMITSLCQRAILLENGGVVFDGGASEAVQKYYLRDGNQPYAVDYAKLGQKVGDEFATLLSAWIEDENGNPVGELDIRSSFKIKLRYALHQAVPRFPVPNFHFNNSQGVLAFASGGGSTMQAEEGIYESTCFVPGNLLNNDIYSIDVALTFLHAGLHVSFHEQSALSVVVVDPIEETLNELRHGYSGVVGGVVRPKLDWEFRKL